MSAPGYDTHVWTDVDGSTFPYRALRPAMATALSLEFAPAIARILEQAGQAAREWDEARLPATMHESTADDSDEDRALDEAALAAIALGSELRGRSVSTSTLLELHASTRPDPSHAGTIRAIPAWIGPDSATPRDAMFVAPDPERVLDLLDDLAAFVGDETVEPVSQAAVAYAQLLTIHPFQDHNGRTARLLAHLVLARRGTTTHAPLPFSAVIALDAEAHAAAVQGLFQAGRIPEWCAVFASCVERSARIDMSLRRRQRGRVDVWMRRAQVDLRGARSSVFRRLAR